MNYDTPTKVVPEHPYVNAGTWTCWSKSGSALLECGNGTKRFIGLAYGQKYTLYKDFQSHDFILYGHPANGVDLMLAVLTV
jgi:hypothetical protein